METITLSQLESHLWEAANILRGPVDAADFKTYVFPLLFFKRLSDVHDEEHAAALVAQPERHRMLSAFFGKNAPGNEQILKAQYGLKPGLNLTALRNFSVPFPDEAEFQRIDERITAFDNLRQSSQRHLNATAAMKRELTNSFFTPT